jgi:hypothetical protein
MQLFENTGWQFNVALAFLVHAQIGSWDTFLESYPAFVRWLFAKRLYVCYVAILGFAFGSVTTLAITGDFGASGEWCWIKPELLRLLLGYVPLWIGYVVIIVCNAINGRVLCKSIIGRAFYGRSIGMLIFIPFIHLLLHIPGSTRRSMEAKGYEGKSYVRLGGWQAWCDPLEGVLR